MPFSALTIAELDIDQPDGGTIKFSVPQTDDMFALVGEVLGGKAYPPLMYLKDAVDCFIDIGANIGSASLYFRLFHDRAALHCYEPQADSFALLKKNLGPLPNVHLTQAALSSAAGQAPLHLAGHAHEFSSLHVGAVPPMLSETVTVLDTAEELTRAAGRAMAIALKIDTEGNELPILRAIPDELFARVALVYLEYHSEEARLAIDALLSGRGFVLTNSWADEPHRGKVCYVGNAVLTARTHLHAARIGPQD
ncbi:MAG TPA: FkbM family methyltransferase [Patescibacteria group bacterium]|nr:FkbM family methyltransferase [Patescibacteria group bacterium]